MKLGEGFEVGEINETILDIFGQSFVCCMGKSGIIPLTESGSSGEVYEVACSLFKEGPKGNFIIEYFLLGSLQDLELK